MKTYQVKNPLWLSDTFIFKEKEGIGTIYVKINCRNKIEEIGIDIEKRLHNCQFDKIRQLYGFGKATPLNQSILNRIGDEYWYQLVRRERLEAYE